MKNKRILLVAIITAMMLFLSVSVYALSLNLEIKGENTVEVNQKIQLSAEYWIGNEMEDPNEPGGGLGEVSRDDVSEQSTWTSSDENVATVDNKGEVTGVTAGNATITAVYIDEPRGGVERTATHDITVTEAGAGVDAGIYFEKEENATIIPLGQKTWLVVNLVEIPQEQNRNVIFTSDEEIIEVEKVKAFGEEPITMIKIKGVSEGNTTITAKLEYNETTYTDTYDLSIIDTNTTVQKGDVNGDGEITATDLLQMKKYIVRLITTI